MTHGQLALLLFLPFSLFLFSRYRPHVAVAAVFLIGAMFLPTQDGWNPPLLPALNKNSVTVLCAFIGCLWAARERMLRARPGLGVDVWIVVMFLGGLGTALSNGDVVQALQPRPALGLHDAVSIALLDLITYGLPFFMGRAMFRSRGAIEDLLRMLTVAGIVYAFLAMVEMRLSPQLHRWIYGYHANKFFTVYRLGGWRPMLFMDSGIALGDFMAMTVLASFTLWRVRAPLLGSLTRLAGPLARWVPAFLLLILVGCRSLGAIVYGVTAAPVIAWLSARRISAIALVLGAIAIAYPSLRVAHLFPSDTLVSLAATISPTRAESLRFRFDTEETLMNRDLERAWFGWGGSNRDRTDPETGKTIYGIDGFWIITLGQRGIVGLAAAFALLAVPILAAWRRARAGDDEKLSMLLAGLSLIIAIRAVDMLPNGFYGSLLFLVAGALHGGARAALEPVAAAVPSEPAAPAPPHAAPTPAPAGRRLADLLRSDRP